MCGRFSLGVDPESIWDDLPWVERTPELAAAHPELWRPRFNVAPDQLALVIGKRPDHPAKMAWMRFGLVPHWAKPGSKASSTRPINARAETVGARATFRDAFRRSRCLVPVDGWYEWSGEGAARQAHWLHAADGELLTIAAIWDRWRDPQSETPRFGFAILTVPAAGSAAALHPRMPLVIPPERRDAWLAPGPYEGPLEAEGHVVERPVGRHVNDVRHDDPSCRGEPA